ncbi:MAG: GntR family transcriptional regulator [Pseudorhodoplanes sp.]|nr:GntR family transcriptional regulator [Pseudorhodoplanes sp.]
MVRRINWPAAAAERSETIAARIYRDLRRDIVDLVLPPRTRLSEKDLSDRLGVSRSPIREALLKLADEGLVWVRPQSGTAVAPILISDVFDGQFVRESLERAALERAIAALDRAGERELREIIGLQKAYAVTRNENLFFQADEDLHAAFFRIAGHERSWRIVQNAKVQMNRVRRLAVNMPLKMDAILSEHEAIVAAMLARNTGGALNELTAHLRRLFTTVERLLESHHDFFVDDRAAGRGYPRDPDAAAAPA